MPLNKFAQGGNQFLKEVVKRLKKCLPKNYFLCQLSVDEFAILLPEIVEESEGDKLAQEVVNIIEQPITIENKEFFSSFSIGVSFYPNDGSDIITLSFAGVFWGQSRYYPRHYLYL